MDSIGEIRIYTHKISSRLESMKSASANERIRLLNEIAAAADEIKKLAHDAQILENCK